MKGTGVLKMATQYKKIQNKLHPKEQPTEKQDLKPKASRDALLLVLIAMTVVILVIGWSTMDNLGHAMYASMLVGMVIVYLNRRLTNISENVRKVLIGISSAALLGSIAMLGYSMYLQFIK